MFNAEEAVSLVRVVHRRTLPIHGAYLGVTVFVLHQSKADWRHDEDTVFLIGEQRKPPSAGIICKILGSAI